MPTFPSVVMLPHGSSEDVNVSVWGVHAGTGSFDLLLTENTNFETVISEPNRGIFFKSITVQDAYRQGVVVWKDVLNQNYAVHSWGLPTVEPLIRSRVSDTAPTASSFKGAAGLSTVNNFYKRMILVFESGNLKGVPRKITDYTGGSTRQFTFDDNFPLIPANGDIFCILGLTFP